MLDFFIEIVKLPWVGAKVILSVISFSMIISGTGMEFSEPEIVNIISNNSTSNISEIFITSSIPDSFNEKVKKTLLSSTKLRINYKIKSKIEIFTFFKEFSYDIFKKELSIYSSVLNSSKKISAHNKSYDIFISEVAKEFIKVNLKLCDENKITSFKKNKSKRKLLVDISVSIVTIHNTDNIKYKKIKLWDKDPSVKFEIDL